MMTRLCPNCNTSSPDTANFCFACGATISPQDSSTVCPPNGNSASGSLSRLGPQQYIDTLVAGQHAIRSERRIVTTLFADVVNSTPMAERLDPEDVTDIMNGAFGVLIEPIDHHDGTLARLMGDAVLCLFGAPIAHEDDPLRACRAALEILNRASDYDVTLRKKYGVQFQVRVGITTGLAVVGEVGTERRAEYTAMGDAVNLAARLQSTALPGTALIDAATHAQVRRALETEDMGRVDLKGKSESVQVYKLMQRRLGYTVATPEGVASPMVNRKREVAQVVEAIGKCGDGQGSALIISGDAGIGKTRLLQEARERAPESVAWIEGHCSSHARDMSYWAAQEVLQTLLEIDPLSLSATVSNAFRRGMAFASQRDTRATDGDDTRAGRRARAEITAPLAHLLNIPMDKDESNYVSSLTADELRQEVQQSFRELISHHFSTKPLVLVWEDIHWIDAQSLEIVEALCRSVQDNPLTLILVTRPARDEDIDLSARVRAWCGDLCQEIRLAPLLRSDSEQLLLQLSGDKVLPPEVVERVLAIAEGNPFCIEEMLRSLSLGEGETRDLDRAGVPYDSKNLTVPAPVQAAILARADRLPARDKKVLQTATVIGRVFHPDVLHLVIEPRISIDELTQSLETLEAGDFISRASRGLADPTMSQAAGFGSAVRLAQPQALSTYGPSNSIAPQFLFRHAVVAEVVYQSLLRSERRQLHGRVGAIIEALFSDRLNKLAPTLAYHYEKGHVTGKAVEHLLRTAEQAKDVSALERAVDCYRRALELTENAADDELARSARPRLREGLADVHFFRGEYPAAIRMYEDVLKVEDDACRRAAIMRKKGKVFEKRGQWDQAHACFMAALEEMKARLDEQEAAAIYSGLSLVYCHQGEFEEATRIGHLALAMFRKVADQRGEAQTCSNLGVIMARRREWDQAAEFHHQGRTLYETIGDRYGLASCDNNLGCLEKEREQWEPALAHFRSSLAQFERLGNEHAMARVYDNMSEVFYELNQPERAQEYMEKAVTILAEVGSDSAGPVAEMWQSGTW